MTDNKPDFNKAVVCIGSNVGNRRDVVAATLAAVSRDGLVTVSSGVYETEADNGFDAPYINLVAVVETPHSLSGLKALAKELEREAGRTELSSSSAMPLDVDIIVWNGVVIDTRQYGKPYFKEGYARVAVDVSPIL